MVRIVCYALHTTHIQVRSVKKKIFSFTDIRRTTRGEWRVCQQATGVKRGCFTHCLSGEINNIKINTNLNMGPYLPRYLRPLVHIHIHIHIHILVHIYFKSPPDSRLVVNWAVTLRTKYEAYSSCSGPSRAGPPCLLASSVFVKNGWLAATRPELPSRLPGFFLPCIHGTRNTLCTPLSCRYIR